MASAGKTWIGTPTQRDEKAESRIELSEPPAGERADRALRIDFGRFLADLARAPEPGPNAQEELLELAAGAEFLHEIMSGGPPLDAPPEGPHSLSSYVLSLTDGALDAAHRILGHEEYTHLGYRSDPEGEALALMMRLTDHLDPEGHAFDSIFGSLLGAEPAEDPAADPWEEPA